MTFAEQMVAKLRDVLAANAGVKQLTVDGNTVQYDDLLNQLTFWERKVARESGSRPRASQIKLSGF